VDRQILSRDVRFSAHIGLNSHIASDSPPAGAFVWHMLLIAALAVIWNLLGHPRLRFRRPALLFLAVQVLHHNR
jgi:hypothetical protein